MAVYGAGEHKMAVQMFTNSEECRGVAVVPEDAPTDIAVIEITGRYPESGWAVNLEVHEIVHITRGFGSVAIMGAELQDLCAGDIVYISPGKAFAWDGHMELVMACTPPFDPNQYEILIDREQE